MTILLFVIPISLLLSLGFVAAFIWAVDSDQMQGLDEHARSILDESRKEEA